MRDSTNTDEQEPCHVHFRAEIREFSVADGCGPQIVVGRRNTLRQSIRRVWWDHLKQR